MKKRFSAITVFQWFLVAVLFVFIALSFTEPVNLVTSDLGRHLVNGRIFLTQGHLLTTNYYSYTEPQHPVITHHWLAGVIFFCVAKTWGFTGLSVFYTLLALLTVFLFFDTARRESGFYQALFFTLLSVPLLASRAEIRPEGFSYLFLSIYFYLLCRFKKGDISFVWLWILVALQIFWVNIHIFFIFGLILIGAFGWEAWFVEKNRAKAQQLLFLAAAGLAACFINPFGLEGVLVPLTIFKNYGYKLAENQSIFFMQRRFPANALYLYFEVIFGVFVMSFILARMKENWKSLGRGILLGSVFSFLAFKMIRGIPMFGLFFIPIAASNFNIFFKGVSFKRFLDFVFLSGFLLVLLVFWVKDRPQFLRGLLKDSNDAAFFFQFNKLKGPVFNNYDIGGYLIYHLFPQERVFVDNRPEAYSTEFFKNIYIPMQENEAVWERMDQQAGFNAIFFYRLDITPWAQPFLIRRIQDPRWAPVYVDNYAIILLKRNAINEPIIKDYELPPSMFIIRKPR